VSDCRRSGRDNWLDCQPSLTDILPGTTVHRKTRPRPLHVPEIAANFGDP
jgi:hypothetical protein